MAALQNTPACRTLADEPSPPSPSREILDGLVLSVFEPGKTANGKTPPLKISMATTSKNKPEELNYDVVSVWPPKDSSNLPKAGDALRITYDPKEVEPFYEHDQPWPNRTCTSDVKPVSFDLVEIVKDVPETIRAHCDVDAAGRCVPKGGKPSTTPPNARWTYVGAPDPAAMDVKLTSSASDWGLLKIPFQVGDECLMIKIEVKGDEKKVQALAAFKDSNDVDALVRTLAPMLHEADPKRALLENLYAKELRLVGLQGVSNGKFVDYMFAKGNFKHFYGVNGVVVASAKRACETSLCETSLCETSSSSSSSSCGSSPPPYKLSRTNATESPCCAAEEPATQAQ